MERNIDVKGKEAYDSFNTDKTILHVRDMLYTIGKIIGENLEDSMYIATVRVGFLNLNEAVVIIKIVDNILYIYSVAEEGMVNQHCCEKAIQKVRKELLNEG